MMWFLSLLLWLFFLSGNKAMQSKLYADAIELYTCAIALGENNAVYYSNRCINNYKIMLFLT